MDKNNSNNYFNMFAKYYRNYAEEKRAYLDSVDEIIINKIKEIKATTMLDIGSGDGVRAINIAESTGIKKLYLLDPSIEMIKLCKAAKHPEFLDIKFFLIPAEELITEDKFEIITCLWNVLGHISNRKKRIKALNKMSNALSDKGSLFLDVNNRHNLNAYGYYGSRHILKDIFLPEEKNGDISFQHEFNGELIFGYGHLFSPKEIEAIIRDSNLRIVRRLIIDYKMGKKRLFTISGQLFFELMKR